MAATEALSASASFLPFWVWLAPAAGITAAQVAVTWAVFRPGRRGLLRAAVALLLADAALVVPLRACVGVMGRMDYSEQFLQWRLWFLAMGGLLLALPLPLWATALRLAGVRRRSVTPAAIHPIFASVLAMWALAGVMSGPTCRSLTTAKRKPSRACGSPAIRTSAKETWAARGR